MKRITFKMLLIMACMQTAHALSNTVTYGVNESPSTDPKSFAYISSIEIAAPLNYFLIVKSENDICAIRFTTFSRGYDAKEPSFFSGGEENLYAEYDWYYLGKNPKFKGKSGHEKLNRSRTIQILGFHGFLPGKRDIYCGDLGLSWDYPIAIGFMGTGGTFLFKVGIGVTPWTSFSQIDLNSQFIQWYFYDSSRKEEYISINKFNKE